jgi:CTP:molybdopterin cytidylyltransferase MocA
VLDPGNLGNDGSMTDSSGAVVGVLLAAGAGRRMGRPKALVEGWLVASLLALREGGCSRVLVVLGAAVEEARPLLQGYDVEVVVAEDWDEGMGASLRAGLEALRVHEHATVALVSLVDLPDVGADVVRRLLDRPLGSATLARAAYDGTPGHPVLIGRAHWAAVIASAHGDQGARAYLREHEVAQIECGDLATGVDVDR